MGIIVFQHSVGRAKLSFETPLESFLLGRLPSPGLDLLRPAASLGDDGSAKLLLRPPASLGDNGSAKLLLRPWRAHEELGPCML
mmetsp:Transcript_148762/g.257648  ORF Transcript_148762/g.257648 Transcript_148762/m.257648 type:complete len:84 (+) Transcript_148762:675-926(+)